MFRIYQTIPRDDLIFNSVSDDSGRFRELAVSGASYEVGNIDAATHFAFRYGSFFLEQYQTTQTGVTEIFVFETDGVHTAQPRVTVTDKLESLDHTVEIVPITNVLRTLVDGLPDDRTRWFQIECARRRDIRNVHLVSQIDIPAAISDNWTPCGLSLWDYTLTSARAQDGSFLGMRSIARGYQSTLKITNIPTDWLEDNYSSVVATITANQFYLQVDGHLGLVWLAKSLAQPVYQSNRLASWDWHLAGG